MALSDVIELDTEKKLCIVHVAIYGNKGKPS
ncbi:Hypothetical protein BCO_0122707 (plasmid) [Borrelia coriaceae ATCC 43381]|uniref:Uncharacterized protein n=1 Tax=Borrelia coriaceae ATCC 43381 TaxID=1408429 RepID=W5SZ91_9SPIR|nr:Hypothetical protein BCO_0122707 [Borrelia coriaceae ATCC 43381]